MARNIKDTPAIRESYETEFSVLEQIQSITASTQQAFKKTRDTALPQNAAAAPVKNDANKP